MVRYLLSAGINCSARESREEDAKENQEDFKKNLLKQRMKARTPSHQTAVALTLWTSVQGAPLSLSLLPRTLVCVFVSGGCLSHRGFRLQRYVCFLAAECVRVLVV